MSRVPAILRTLETMVGTIVNRSRFFKPAAIFN
jgi:hypothetical protein